MKYVSTRGGVAGLSFEEAVLSGLADDGGLLVPQTIPVVNASTLTQWSTLTFPQLTFEIMSRFISEEEIPHKELKLLIEKSMGKFDTPEITPVVRVGNNYILELFHGPTYSFKDVALQFLGNLFEHILTKRNSTVTVVGATSGDTGSAAIYGLKGKKNVDVYILYPKGRVSKIQELQMTSVLDSNIHNISISGTFDDAQSIVKGLFGDLNFKKKHHLAAINSINWSRILSQTVYYFYAYFRVHDDLQRCGFLDPCLYFSVPTGNFGDILAGYYAKQMGLPISLIAATNQNDIIHRFFDKGEYHRNGNVIATCSPSMDIQVASNFERYLYHLTGSDAKRLHEWMDLFHTTGKLSVSGEDLFKAKGEMLSYSVSHDEIISTIQSVYKNHKYVIDPHTAIGICAANNITKKGNAVAVCLATAHPAKFMETVDSAVGDLIDSQKVIDTAPGLACLLKGVSTRSQDTEPTLAAVRCIIESNQNSGQ